MNEFLKINKLHYIYISKFDLLKVYLYRMEDRQKTKKTLEETEQNLEELDGVTSVHAKYEIQLINKFFVF